jgi:hypothetical protein
MKSLSQRGCFGTVFPNLNYNEKFCLPSFWVISDNFRQSSKPIASSSLSKDTYRVSLKLGPNDAGLLKSFEIGVSVNV